MVFSSIVFLFFFLPLVLAVYFLTPGIRARNIVLLVFSLLFYAWGEGELVLLMVLSSLFNYAVGLWIDRKRGSSIPIITGVAVNLGLLVYFKYISFLVGSIDAVLGTHWNNGIDIRLPLGISFFTFHCISYIVDVHRGHAKVQRNAFDVMLYIAVFPQLIAGPILRYTQTSPYLKVRTHTLEGFVEGAKRFCVGLAKKVLIANVMGEIADEVFHMPHEEWYFALTWFAICAYALQIYFDFSGYSDMAIGLGRMLGFNFPENFNFPYIARSIKEFWRRWHITLSTWFRDYLYIPLGGNRAGTGRMYFNLIFVFFITGLWHGATWNFVLWGLMHGFFLIIERDRFGALLARFPVLGHTYTLLVVLFAWVLFRLPDLHTVGDFYASMFRPSPQVEGLFLHELLDREYAVIFVLGVLLSMPVRGTILRLKPPAGQGVMTAVWDSASTVFHLLVLLLSAMSIASSTYNPFIYFRF
ncbi:MAG TPA: MBOAT family protein [Flavobacteriales bacterium]